MKKLGFGENVYNKCDDVCFCYTSVKKLPAEFINTLMFYNQIIDVAARSGYSGNRIPIEILQRHVFSGSSSLKEGDINDEKLAKKVATKKAERQAYKFFTNLELKMLNVIKQYVSRIEESVDLLNDEMCNIDGEIYKITR